MILEAKNLKKSFGQLVAVDGVSFQLVPGQILGLLGPNGAGKTTTVSMISGLSVPDSGEVLIEGSPLKRDSDPAKGKIGLVPQDLALYDELSAQNNLQLFGALYSLRGQDLSQRIMKSLDFVGLADRAKDKVSTFSGGMKRRLNLAAALLHDPQLLLLDEPTVGVDPQSRNAIFDNLETLKKLGKAIVYTTHYMEEAERLCERIVIMDHGKVIANDNLRGLHKLLPAANRLRVEIESPPAGDWLEGLRAIPGVESINFADNVLQVEIRELSTTVPKVLEKLASQSVVLQHVVTERADLESIFLSLTGRSLRDL